MNARITEDSERLKFDQRDDGLEAGQILKRIVPRLTSQTPHLDAQVLLAHVLKKTRTWVVAHPEARLTPQELSALQANLKRLESGEPLPYVLGRWEFFGMDFIVSPEVLIPRPETEVLVEKAINWLRRYPRRRRVLDVGTGTGCIAVSLAVQVPELHVTATDISAPALKIARKNARKFRVSRRVNFIQCDLFPGRPDPLPEANKYHMICANLPYIPTSTLESLDVYQREPTLALDGGADGLDLIRNLLSDAPRWLVRGGMILLEIEASQGLPVLSLAYDAFSEASVHLHKDLAGRDRLVEIRVGAQHEV